LPPQSYKGPSDPSGRLVAVLSPNLVRLRDLDAAPDAEPVPLSDRLALAYYGVPTLGESLIAVPRQAYEVLWPLRFRHARVLRRLGLQNPTALAFSPDG
jgi:hypothetical protein